MFLRGDYWHYDFIVGGERYRGSTGFKKNEKSKAAEVESKLKVQAREGHSIEMIWEQTKRKMIAGREIALDYDTVWDAFIRKSSSNAGAHRLKLYAYQFRHFCDWMKEHYPDVKKVSGVMTIHAKEWINAVRDGDGANSTKNDYLSTMKMIFASLGKDYGIVENPFWEIKNLPKNQIPREAFTPEELALIGQKATGWIYSLCLTAVSTGLREGDICMLRKTSVNLATGWISIPKTRKTGVAVDIPLLPGLRKHITEAMQGNDSEFVYPELAEMYSKCPSKIGSGIKEFFEEIGIFGTTKKIAGYKKILSTKDVHSFRHTFVYLAACHGIPFPIVQGIVGHTSPEMTKHYMDHAGRDAKIQYLQQLPDYLTAGHSPMLIEAKNNAPTREITRERVLRILARITPDNLERNKARITALLQR